MIGAVTMRRDSGTAQAGDSRESGMALIAVLWIVAAAALMVSTFNATVRSGASLALSEMRLTRIEALLDAGVEIAAARLIDTEQNRRWRPDGKPHAVSFADADLTIAMHDPRGLVDLNGASPELLLGLLRQFIGAESDATALRDYILKARGEETADGAAAPRPSGLAQRRDATPPQKGNAAQASAGQRQVDAQGVAFIDVSQLGRIEGMTDELYRRMLPFVTVYNPDGSVDETIAPKQVLAALDGADGGGRIGPHAPRRVRPESRPGEASPAQAGGESIAPGRPTVYIVTVRIGRPGTPYHLAKQAVIVTGLDKDAPYRLIAWKALDPSR